MSGHALRIESGWGFAIVCREPEGADCRLTTDDPDCSCESWVLQREPDGTPYHEILDDLNGEVIARHAMKPADYCNVVEFIDQEGVGEAFVGVGVDLSIEPVWEGDTYAWRLAEPVAVQS